MSKVMLNKNYYIEHNSWMTLCDLDPKLPLRLHKISAPFNVHVYCELKASISEGEIYSKVIVPFKRIENFLGLHSEERIVDASIYSAEEGVCITSSQLYSETPKRTPTKKSFLVRAKELMRLH